VKRFFSLSDSAGHRLREERRELRKMSNRASGSKREGGREGGKEGRREGGRGVSVEGRHISLPASFLLNGSINQSVNE